MTVAWLPCVCLMLCLAVIDRSLAFRVTHGFASARRIPGRLRSDHIDEMMFECAIYNSNLRFPRNVDSELNPHAARDSATQSRLESMSLELTKQQLETFKRRKEHMRISLPISGEVSRPRGGHLQKLYYILEEHNRELMENELYRAGTEGGEQNTVDIDNLRKIVLPTQMYRIFDSPSVTKRYRLFPTTIKSHSPVVPGQLSTITLQEPHRELLVEQVRSSNVFGIPVAFLEPSKFDNVDPEISPHACMCEFVDLTDFDTTGKIVVRATQRLSIVDMPATKDPIVLADVSILEDERERLRNPNLTQGNARAVAKLYDKCNEQEAQLSRLEGRMGDVEIVESRELFADKLGRMIRDVPLDGDHEYRILELTGFAAMEFHADTETRMWAANTRDTEERLACAKTVLEEKSAYLKGRISEVKRNADPPIAVNVSDVNV
ncbi:hypothetical protein, conserved [Babesia bigemina]|uniref:Uncharacterized protein n=1 Tax=Babesia bigemina TaxID=5866 RepID=A0A061D915_BABBI|nr:hypothetical protein, conserved [Babesia bigemina]CDR97191.1 hypothetical protein, conserved [Babesia bigemina]|eukprot:XP_012769377.1 hypothetical protein, conserved [Babesia bigemina]